MIRAALTRIWFCFSTRGSSRPWIRRMSRRTALYEESSWSGEAFGSPALPLPREGERRGVPAPAPSGVAAPRGPWPRPEGPGSGRGGGRSSDGAGDGRTSSRGGRRGGGILLVSSSSEEDAGTAEEDSAVAEAELEQALGRLRSGFPGTERSRERDRFTRSVRRWRGWAGVSAPWEPPSPDW